MKTKYILHGGGALIENEMNDKFFSEILSFGGAELNILIIPFAIDGKVFKLDFVKSQFERNNIGKKLNFIVATEEGLKKEIKESDIVYIVGGKTLKLLAVLANFKNLANLFERKLVVGESAGAYVLSSFFYSESLNISSEGLKLVPVKTICHFTGEGIERLNVFNSNLETLYLKDFEYMVFDL